MKGRRRYISWKTKCAAAVLDAQLVRERFGLYPQRWYDDAKRMTEDQFLSLFQFDHNILHATEDENRNKFWNLTPMLIQTHRQKTKADAKVIAKSRRLRAKYVLFHTLPASMLDEPTSAEQFSQRWAAFVRGTKPKRKIRSRGFDKSRRRKMSGKVVKREG